MAYDFRYVGKLEWGVFRGMIGREIKEDEIYRLQFSTVAERIDVLGKDLWSKIQELGYEGALARVFGPIKSGEKIEV